jgi:hypothetical protein
MAVMAAELLTARLENLRTEYHLLAAGIRALEERLPH